MGFSFRIVLVLIVVTLAVAGAPCATPEALVGLWANEEGSFRFGADTSVEVRAQGQVFTGMWALEGSLLGLQLQAGAMVFQVALDGDRLVLADADGSYELRRVLETEGTQDGQVATQGQAGQQPQQGAAGESMLNDLQYLRFVENYPQMRPDDIVAHIVRLPQQHYQNFNIWQAFGSDVFFHACQGRYAGQIVWQSLSGPVGCAQVNAERQEAVNFAIQYGAGDPSINCNNERLQVVNMMKCSLGIHDPATCSAYAGTLAAAGQTLAATGQTINDNMSSCTEQWEQQGNDPNTRVYLGCW